MIENFSIRRVTTDEVPAVAAMVGELLEEIMTAIGMRAFNFDLQETSARLEDFIRQEKYVVFLARDGAADAGFIALYESYALYAEGSFGTIPEFFVRPAYRSQGIGRRLIAEARQFGRTRTWQRLEVTTPPLPQFDSTLSFYERHGFAITGGRKLKSIL